MPVDRALNTRSWLSLPFPSSLVCVPGKHAHHWPGLSCACLLWFCFSFSVGGWCLGCWGGGRDGVRGGRWWGEGDVGCGRELKNKCVVEVYYWSVCLWHLSFCKPLCLEHDIFCPTSFSYSLSLRILFH